MTLKSELRKDWEAYSSEHRSAHPTEIGYDLDVETVQHPQLIDDSGRWYNLYRLVFRRGDEYVAVTCKDGATERQEYDAAQRDVKFQEVVPKEVTITEYVPKRT